MRTKSDIAKHVSRLHSWNDETQAKREQLTDSHHASFTAKHKQFLDSSFKVKLGLSNERDQATKHRSQAEAMRSLSQPADATRGQDIVAQQISSLPFVPQLEASFAAKGVGQSTPPRDDQEAEPDRSSGRAAQAVLTERLSSPRRISAMAHETWAPNQMTRRVCVHVSPLDPAGTMCRFCQASSLSNHHTLYSEEHNAGYDGHVRETMQRTRSFSAKGVGEQHVVDLHGHETESRKQHQRRSQEELQAFNARELSEKELKSLLERVRGGKLPKCEATRELRARHAKEVSAIKSNGEDYFARRLHGTHQTMLEKLESARAAIKQREESTSFTPQLSPGSRRMTSPRKDSSSLAAAARELEVGLAGALDKLEASEAAELANMEMAARTADGELTNVITVTCPEGYHPGTSSSLDSIMNCIEMIQ